MYFSMIEYPKHDWHAAFGLKRLWYRCATAGNLILNILLYWVMTMFQRNAIKVLPEMPIIQYANTGNTVEIIAEFFACDTKYQLTA